MILTKDNLLRFVREHKYVTPTTIAHEFETTTMIASAALSELAREGSLGITYLKLSSSPYYYDIKQPESLQDLAEKHFSGNELNVYRKIREQQIVSKGSLTIPEQLAIDRIQDFAKKLELEYEQKEYVFWVWYLRNFSETKKQIENYFSGNTKEQSSKPQKQQKPQNQIEKENIKQELEKQQNTPTNSNNNKETKNDEKQNNFTSEVSPSKNTSTPKANSFSSSNASEQQSSPQNSSSNEFQGVGGQKDEYEQFIENYFHKNYLHIESKQKNEKGISYVISLKLNSLSLTFDAFYFLKKPQEAEVISFYVSSIKPKILFVKQAPKKLYKLAEELDNLEIVNI